MDGVSGITVAPQPVFGEIQRIVQDICGWERYNSASPSLFSCLQINKYLFNNWWKSVSLKCLTARHLCSFYI